MPITYIMPDGTVITTIAQAADNCFQKRKGRPSTPTHATVIIQADQKPGTAAT